jgi:hypothetical protein
MAFAAWNCLTVDDISFESHEQFLRRNPSPELSSDGPPRFASSKADFWPFPKLRVFATALRDNRDLSPFRPMQQLSSALIQTPGLHFLILLERPSTHINHACPSGFQHCRLALLPVRLFTQVIYRPA